MWIVDNCPWCGSADITPLLATVDHDPALEPPPDEQYECLACGETFTPDQITGNVGTQSEPY